MNTTVLRPDRPLGETSRARAIIGALSSLRREEAAFFLLISLVIAAVNGAWGLEMIDKPNGGERLLAGVLMPFLFAPFIGAGWLLADRSEPGAWPRAVRLAVALVASVTAAVIVAPLLLAAVGLLPPAEIKIGRSEMTITLPAWVRIVSLWLEVALHTSLAFAVLEFAAGVKAASRCCRRRWASRRSCRAGCWSRGWRPCRRRWSRSSCSTAWSTCRPPTHAAAAPAIR
jgi:hypothetical protein